VRIGILQLDIAWEEPETNFRKVDEWLQALSAPLDLLVLPECWATGYTMNPEAHRSHDITLAFMSEVARTRQCHVVGGVPAPHEDGQVNRAYLIAPDGHAVGHYDKIKLFGMAGEHLSYLPGKYTRSWPLLDAKLGVLICYDLRFPELSRRLMPGTTLLVYIASWPRPRLHHWRKLLMARAIENQAFVIGVNRIGVDENGLAYSGSSLIIGPQGKILLDAAETEGISMCQIDHDDVRHVRKALPFLQDLTDKAV